MSTKEQMANLPQHRKRGQPASSDDESSAMAKEDITQPSHSHPNEADYLKPSPMSLNGKDPNDTTRYISTPSNPASHTPFAYQLAKQNLISAEKFSATGSLNIVFWPPVFVCNILQFPGTLASVLGLGSSFDITPRMTAGKLRGWAAYAQIESVVGECGRDGGTKLVKPEPMMLETGRNEDCVPGMVVFGRGKNHRHVLDAWFQARGCMVKRRKVDVEIVVQGGAKQVLCAYAWMPRARSAVDGDVGKTEQRWTIQEYVAGSLVPAEDGDDGFEG